MAIIWQAQYLSHLSKTQGIVGSTSHLINLIRDTRYKRVPTWTYVRLSVAHKARTRRPLLPYRTMPVAISRYVSYATRFRYRSRLLSRGYAPTLPSHHRSTSAATCGWNSTFHPFLVAQYRKRDNRYLNVLILVRCNIVSSIDVLNTTMSDEEPHQ